MSLQDDYFDLIESNNLSDGEKEAIERIWDNMIDMENEVNNLRPIVNAVSNLFKDRNPNDMFS
jgi:hypothetical protein